MKVRLIDAGDVSALRSQALYHGLAYARTADTLPTIVLARPVEPYVCIGFHQDAAIELDLDACAADGMRVIRRETGGGAVYIDADQVFVQWIFPPDALPMRMDRRFESFCRPLVETYREFGIAAEFVPTNDVHVGGRKIVGTGAARIGESEVVVGNFLFDFDATHLCRYLNLPWPEYREQVAAAMHTNVTSMREELGAALPESAAIRAAYCRHAGVELTPGEPTTDEAAAIAAVEQRLADPDFVRAGSGMRRPGVKIHQDLWILFASDGQRRLTIRWRRGVVEDLVCVGPDAGDREDVAGHLRGIELTPAALQRASDTIPGDPTDRGAWLDLFLHLESKAPR